MSYSIYVFGHNTPTAKVLEVFDQTIRGLREAAEDPKSIGGSVSGSEDGKSFSRSAPDVDATATDEKVVPHG